MANKPTLIDRARSMRKEQSNAELAVWEIVRARRLGAKFRRQLPVEGYIADFAAIDAKLIVEIDGLSHDAQADYDATRDAALTKAGWRLLRVRDADVVSDVGAVERRIRAALAG